MVTQTVVHFEIPASDAERLSQFYTEVFGWKFQKAPMPGGSFYWLISTGPPGKSVSGGMYPKTGPEEHPRNYIVVAEIDSAIQRFKAAGGVEVVPKMPVPDMGWSFVGADPEGNRIGLFEPSVPVRARPTVRSRARTRARSRGRRRK